jgi:hypothetical protein
VQQDDDGEECGEREERRRRVVDPDEARDRVEPASPNGEDEHDARRQEPEERVALAEAPAANQLEDDEEERDRDERRDDGDAKRGHARSASGARKSPTKSATVTFAM